MLRFDLGVDVIGPRTDGGGWSYHLKTELIRLDGHQISICTLSWGALI